MKQKDLEYSLKAAEENPLKLQDCLGGTALVLIQQLVL